MLYVKNGIFWKLSPYVTNLASYRARLAPFCQNCKIGRIYPGRRGQGDISVDISKNTGEMMCTRCDNPGTIIGDDNFYSLTRSLRNEYSLRR